MLKIIHQKKGKLQLTLRDHLAAHRTYLANDRTWLGYMRTALTLFVAGASFIQFFKSMILQAIGWVFIPIGIVVLIIGLWNYLKVRKMIYEVEYHK